MDMTQGDPVRLLVVFALPLLIGNLFQQAYSMVDTMVAGYNLGDGAIAAIGATASLSSLIVNFAVGMNSGFALVVTRAFGAHDVPRLKRSVAGMVVLNAAVTLALTVLSVAFMRPMMRLMNTPGEIFEDAWIYIVIVCGGMAATVAYNMFAGILRAVGNSRTSLYFLILSCVTNMALDLLFIAGFKTGVAGAAAATVLSQLLSAVLSGIYVLKSYGDLMPEKKDFAALTAGLMKDLSTNGLAMAFMYCVVDIGSVVFMSANNRLGQTLITAHTAARRLIVILMMPHGTLAVAASTYVGQNTGAGRSGRIREGLRDAMLLEVGWGLLACLLAYVFGERMVRLTTGSSTPEMIANAVMSLRINLPFYPALGILVCIRSSMQAMGQRLVTVVSSSMELAVKCLAAVWLIPAFGYVGTCVTEPITWVLCAAFLMARYLSTRKAFFDRLDASHTEE